MEQKNNRKGVIAAFGIAALTSITTLGFAMQAQAQEAKSAGNYIAEDGGTARINQAGKLRLFSQRIPVVACVLVYSGKAEAMMPMLSNSINQYDKIINALRVGDPEMKIFGVEKKHRVIAHLDELTALWEPFRVAAKNIEAGEKVDESLAFLSENHMQLLKVAKLLVSEVRTVYSNPVEITGAEALLIDFAGRQRMLSQKIAKEICGIETGNQALGSLDDLNKTVALFEATLLALKDGMPSAGIAPPPTDQIREEIEKAFDDWQEIKTTLSGVTGKGSVGSDTVMHLFDLLEAKREKMNTITGLYAEYARTHD